MYGEGYDYTPQYSAMSDDLVGSLPVGMKSRENFDVPYWPVHNHPNYKEVWVHPVSRWFWLMADALAPELPPKLDFRLTQETSADCRLTIQLEARGRGTHRFTLRTENLSLDQAAAQDIQLKPGGTAVHAWHGKMLSTEAPWVAVAIADENAAQRRDVTGKAK
jgi:hypothetical protein